jgi:hypothetical protein
MSVTSGLRAADCASGEQVVVRFEGEIPERFVCAGVRYRVTDMPTRLEDELSVLTHPLAISGWRFQGTDEDGASHMFDVCRRETSWELLRMWD